MNPFNHNYFLGYVNEITPQYVKVHFPSSNLLEKFTHKGVFYAGGNVGNFIVIEGEEFGFLARIIELELPDGEKKSISEKAIQHDETTFHPSGKAELLLSFSVFEPQKTEKTVSKYPTIGAKVYSCSDEQIETYVKEFGRKKDEEVEVNVYADLGKLTSNDANCRVSLNSVFGRHCAVVGTTGGGKSWTIAKLVSEIVSKTDNKVILIDATGEYSKLTTNSLILGTDTYFPYQDLSIPDLFFLLRPTGQSQRPVLLEAIRSLKMVRIAKSENSAFTSNTKQKADQEKAKYNSFYQKHIKEIEDNTCNFDITHLIEQIKEECIYPIGYTNKVQDPQKWGGYDAKTYDYQTSLISRISDLINTKIFNNLLGFQNVPAHCSSVVNKINSFLSEKSNQILRISFENIPSSFAVKEITANALATFLLNLARGDKFKNDPLILVIDEAHQFLNKNIKDEYFESQTLDAFDLIAKECRKYGMFLCLATQMPRDIPVGTLSQMGTFIVHRLINELDKKSIESAASSANRSALSFLPILGEGEALLVGVDFPMPLLIKVTEPEKKPQSRTPKLKAKKGTN
ncbi:ATP-binding protein [Agriterribacter sp.]|uniref:ATP-binding protein n=1 Tax=Agriterribacter sp. TaxID=2821509 RepID=UPI002BDDFCDE|nr:ATP-binding protein [Agriterribacter sp.]HRO44823.1 ATP-binding protein [Agriterribacter sp.]HRQ18045.1 ATP-binding protein [Agriterribacter sp.]